jgi:hypothetical protein
MVSLMLWLFDFMLIVASSPCRAVLTTHAAGITNSCGPLPKGCIHTASHNDASPEATHITPTTCMPRSMVSTSSHVLNGGATFAHKTEPRSTVLVTGTERSTSNSTATVARVDPDPNSVHVRESDDSRLLSIVFFAVSALLTLATIVVAVVYGWLAAQAAKRLSNALVSSMHEGSRASDIEMADRANADQVSNSSSMSITMPT